MSHDPSGVTRSQVCHDHAMIAPDSHVVAPLPSWRDAEGVVLISPAMGARFCMYDMLLEVGVSCTAEASPAERCVYVLDGEVTVEAAGESRALSAGGFAFLPPNEAHQLDPKAKSTVTVFEKAYVPCEGYDTPGPVFGVAADMPAEPFMGDPDAMLTTLLPDDPAFDMAVNVFTFQPGATLPMVEVHVMEHGLRMLEGGGVYRLSDSWYPVQAGDTIWMASYCPQWFVAAGKTPSAYLYYKDVNRDPLHG